MISYFIEKGASFQEFQYVLIFSNKNARVFLIAGQLSVMGSCSIVAASLQQRIRRPNAQVLLALRPCAQWKTSVNNVASREMMDVGFQMPGYPRHFGFLLPLAKCPSLRYHFLLNVLRMLIENDSVIITCGVC